jgi:DNA primase
MFDINSFLLSLYEQFLFDKKNILELEYLKKRGLDEQTIKYFHLGFAPNNTSLIKQILTNENEMFGNQYNKNLI